MMLLYQVVVLYLDNLQLNVYPINHKFYIDMYPAQFAVDILLSYVYQQHHIFYMYMLMVQLLLDML